MKRARGHGVLSLRTSGRTRGMGLTVLALLLAWALFGCESRAPASPRVRAENVWSRPAMTMGHEAGSTGVVYLVLVNDGREADRLLGAKTDVAASVELHQTTMEGGMMRMRPVPGGIEIPAGGRVELKPGGLHLMLINLQRALTVGDRFTVALAFEKSRTISAEAEVKMQ